MATSSVRRCGVWRDVFRSFFSLVVVLAFLFQTVRAGVDEDVQRLLQSVDHHHRQFDAKYNELMSEWSVTNTKQKVLGIPELNEMSSCFSKFLELYGGCFLPAQDLLAYVPPPVKLSVTPLDAGSVTCCESSTQLSQPKVSSLDIKSASSPDAGSATEPGSQPELPLVPSKVAPMGEGVQFSSVPDIMVSAVEGQAPESFDGIKQAIKNKLLKFAMMKKDLEEVRNEIFLRSPDGSQFLNQTNVAKVAHASVTPESVNPARSNASGDPEAATLVLSGGAP